MAPAVPSRVGPFVRVADLHPEPPAVADVVADLLRQERDAQDDVVEAAVAELLELPVDERASGHLEHRLGDGERPGAHARREPSGEDYGLHCASIVRFMPCDATTRAAPLTGTAPLSTRCGSRSGQ